MHNLIELHNQLFKSINVLRHFSENRSYYLTSNILLYLKFGWSFYDKIKHYFYFENDQLLLTKDSLKYQDIFTNLKQKIVYV